MSIECSVAQGSTAWALARKGPPSPRHVALSPKQLCTVPQTDSVVSLLSK